MQSRKHVSDSGSIRRSAIAAIAVLGTVKRHGVWLIAMDRIYGLGLCRCQELELALASFP